MKHKSQMESQSTNLGGSLKVPIVQELAKENMTRVPSRYIRDDHDHFIPSESDLPFLPQIPVIDMHNLSDPTFMDSELHKLHQSCQQWGFFQLINHDMKAVERMKLETQEFFNLRVEEKNKFYKEAGDIQGYGQTFVVSEEQKLDWSDIFYIVTLPPSLRKPHLIPKLPYRFRDGIEAYAEEVKGVAMKILRLMGQAVGMRSEEMETLFGDGTQAMRMNYYPPCPQPELVKGICPHSDAAGLTILLQVNEIEGLQIKKDGVWVPVSPLPDAFIINIGDILEIVTNGCYRSVEHRATVNASKERVSIATFLSPDLKGYVGPAASLVSGQTPPKFKTISTADYFRGFYSKELNGKSC